MKYTAKDLKEAVESSTSILQVVCKLGIKYRSGGAWNSVKKRIQAANLDTSHFLGFGHRKGQLSVKKSAAAVLVFNPNMKTRESPARLRRAMLEIGMKHVCGECELGPVWNGKYLVLDVDHKNGNWRDNTPTNLRFLCPNCHTQQPTSGRRPGVCSVCGIESQRRTCPRCAATNASRHVDHKDVGIWPEDLHSLAASKPVTAIASMVGVSEAAVRKRLKKLGIETRPPGYWSKHKLGKR